MLVTKLLGRVFGTPEVRGLMLGLDASGRTTALYAWVSGQVQPYTLHTIGFNVETVPRAGMRLTMWDTGGCDKVSRHIRHTGRR